MPKLSTAQLSTVASRFLAGNPAAAARIAALTEADADFMGTTLDSLRLDRTMDEIDKYARENGRDAMALRYSLAAETAAEFDEMWRAHQAAVNEALGL